MLDSDAHGKRNVRVKQASYDCKLQSCKTWAAAETQGLATTPDVVGAKDNV